MATKVFIPELFDGFNIKVALLASKEIRKRGFKFEGYEELGGWRRNPPGTNLVFEGPDEKAIAKIFREKVREVKKAGKPKRKGRT
jgi:hypothetical protein